jgi:archaellum component FlaC
MRKPRETWEEWVSKKGGVVGSTYKSVKDAFHAHDEYMDELEKQLEQVSQERDELRQKIRLVFEQNHMDLDQFTYNELYEELKNERRS